MRKILLATILAAMSASVLAGGSHPCQKNCGTPPSQSSHNHATSNANQKQYQHSSSSSKSDSTALAGAYSTSSSDSLSKSHNEGNNTSLNQHYEGDRYPDIPVNAGVVFASVCQEGSSATNSKISISLVTDSSYCNRLMQADAYFKMFQVYSKQCNADLNSVIAGIRHDRFIASQVKGVKPLHESDYDDPPEPESCDQAELYRVAVGDELSKAQKMLDRTSFTGMIAKWSAQMGIPASLLYVLIGAL